MIRPVECRLCRTKHWSYEPHNLASVIGREFANAAVRKQDRAIKALYLSLGSGMIRAVMCGHARARPKRGPMPQFCSDTCRKRAARAKVKAP